MAENIIIGYRNLFIEDNAAIGSSTADASFGHANLGMAHPSEFWRATTVDPSCKATLDVDSVLSSPDIRLICPLYVTATAIRNLVPWSQNPLGGVAGGEWVVTNGAFSAFASPGTTPLACRDSVVTALADDATSGTHTAVNDYTIPWGTALNGQVATFTLSGFVWFSTDTDSNLKLLLTIQEDPGGSAEYVSFRFDPDAPGTLDLVTDGTSTNLTNYAYTYTQDSLATKFYRLDWSVSVSASAVSTIRTLIQTIRASDDAGTYSGSAEKVVFVAPTMQLSPSNTKASVPATTSAIVAPTWQVRIGDDPTFASYEWASNGRHLISSENQAFAEARGWTHGDPVVIPNTGITSGTPPTNRYYMEIFFYDPDNTATDLDVSNIYVGPMWQPTRNVVGLQINPNAYEPAVGRSYGGQEYRAQIDGPREWQIDLGFQTWADAMREAHAMGIRQGQHSPVLVIRDADDKATGAEGILYGTLSGLTIGQSKWFQDRGDSTAGNMPAVSFRVRELLP